MPGDQKATSDLAALRAHFRRNGYVRSAEPARRRTEGSDRYKKGWEVRFVLSTQQEADDVRRLIRGAGLKPGKTFRKHDRIVQPVYGKHAVELFVT